MVLINRLKIIVNTAQKNFGFDNKFTEGVNFIASTTNTMGKSSCIGAIFYCLGLEEMLGGKNSKVLKPVYKNKIEYEGIIYVPIKSEFYLEVRNTTGDIITINRTVMQTTTGDSLVKVYRGDIDTVIEGKIMGEEMYVHLQGAATSEKGFHRFLEEFIGWNLPKVPTYDDKNRKLYMQTIFPALFIEQMNGWSNLLATIPSNLGIKDVKRKAIEFILDLDVIENERLKSEYLLEENAINNRWTKVIDKIQMFLDSQSCWIKDLYIKPRYIEEVNLKKMIIYKKQENKDIPIDDYIKVLIEKDERISLQHIRVGENVSELETELESLKAEVQNDEKILQQKQEKIYIENKGIDVLLDNLQVINRDISNNQDVKKIKNLGVLQDTNITKDICPTCNQSIKDCLLPQDNNFEVMSIEENILHLKEQRAMIEFAIDAHKINIKELEREISQLQDSLIIKRRKLRVIINDLYLTDDNLAQTIVFDKIKIQEEIDNLIKMEKDIEYLKSDLLEISEDWISLSEKKKKCATTFTEKDEEKISYLEKQFIEELEKFRYSSMSSLNDIKISKDKLLPTVDGFDLKFDGSASDNIRVNWAFSIALLKTSYAKSGNHPSILIFDEPAQQSIDENDLHAFLEDLSSINFSYQAIVGITLNNKEVTEYVKSLTNVSMILIEDKAIKPI